MGKITILANRLAESILMDWDKEEVIKFAKEVAVACHENIEFISLVQRMRDAQWAFDMITGEDDIEYIDKLQIVKREAEREVDEYLLKKMEEEK
jgi:hypothetical protein